MHILRSTAALLVVVASCWAGEEAMSSGFRVLYSVYRQCESKEEPFACLKARAVKLVDRAIHSDSIPIVDGISLVKRPESERSLKNDLDPLPNEIEPRKVDDLLWDRVTAFLESHSVQFRLPEFVKEIISEGVDEEGRGRKNKRMLPALLMALMLKGSMLAMAMKGLALLAGKALIVSKMALVLAGVIALKKLFSGGGEKTTYEIVKQPIVSHSHQYSTSHEYGDGGYEHGGYGRSLDLSAQEMAYAAQAPKQS
ncbi:uncharacterized protein [Halyomorpha halys]|uniref:uncharacterized protein n=1 Tax=Halyomorpha halys TaxID=286706 RepID=UPI0006D50BE8|nr:uncharacterized protein LOC106679280 [Halyomorpha halys]